MATLVGRARDQDGLVLPLGVELSVQRKTAQGPKEDGSEFKGRNACLAELIPTVSAGSMHAMAGSVHAESERTSASTPLVEFAFA